MEGRAIRRRAVRGQHELDGEFEEGTEPSRDIVARDVLATAKLNVQPAAEVRQRVAGDQRVDRRQPEDEIVVLTTGIGGDAERPRSGLMEMSFAFAVAQPGKVVTLHAAHTVGVDAELLDPVLPRVSRRPRPNRDEATANARRRGAAHARTAMLAARERPDPLPGTRVKCA